MPRIFQKIIRRLRFKFIDGPMGKGSPVAVDVWDKQFQEGFWGKLESPGEMAHYAVIAGYLPYTCENPSILDIGCGQGHLAPHLLRSGADQYTGVDLSAKAIEIANSAARIKCQFTVGDFNVWRPAEVFDVIIFNESIYYAIDPREVLSAFQPFARHAIIISMCEYANHATIWKKFEKTLKPSAHTRLENERGQVWQVRLYHLNQ
jgi:2-polyprenyl-3-methyl-5-hydroxy-6-metoxy-1,4-benzoquinol methylase